MCQRSVFFYVQLILTFTTCLFLSVLLILASPNYLVAAGITLLTAVLTALYFNWVHINPSEMICIFLPGIALATLLLLIYTQAFSETWEQHNQLVDDIAILIGLKP